MNIFFNVSHFVDFFFLFFICFINFIRNNHNKKEVLRVEMFRFQQISHKNQWNHLINCVHKCVMFFSCNLAIVIFGTHLLFRNSMTSIIMNL